MTRSPLRVSVLIFAVLAFPALMLAQNGSIVGNVNDAESGDPLVSASVLVVGTTLGAATDSDGNYVITNVPPGTYTVRATFLGYASITRTVTVGAGTVTLDFSLSATVIQYGEVVVDANRARERETPVAFTTVSKDILDERMHGQDAPMLLRGTPGLYAYGTDGLGSTGEGQLYVRGFSQNYVQVLINGVPTNDPESNAVYWSNWGSVSSNAASIQVQRGAGSSLYGAGSFGGSFNIVTSDALPESYYGANATFGSPLNTFFGVNLNSGLLSNNMAFSVRVDRKITEGSRRGARYEGLNYYLSGAWYFTENQSVKLVLHGAPQQHGYSFSNDISYFKRYGYDANQAPWLPRDVVEQLPPNATTGEANFALLDDKRELVDNEKVALAHNFFHKPQLELHYANDISPTSSFRATFFYSIGRGGGSSLNGSGTVYRRSSTNNAITDLVGANGQVADVATATNVYLNGAYQRTSYSLHQQTGIIASYDVQPVDMVRLTLGGEFRSWSANHPGHFTNMYGGTSVTRRYETKLIAGGVGTFNRLVYQGDMTTPGGVDVGSVFGWKLAGANDPTYRTQYRNYRGETPQYTIYAQANVQPINKLNVLGSLQYVWYRYRLTENMPSENAVGQELTSAQATSLGLGSAANEGPHPNGKFYMLSTTGTWHEFVLVDAERSRGFLQPKIGANYNFTENLNVFANFAHVERFTDLSIYYNSGNLNPDAEDEKSNQWELGAGWTQPDFSAKLNLYTMTWDNKSASIQDISKAGQPGYNRNGFRTELVGSSRHQGVEFEFAASLDRVLPVRGFDVRGSFTLMDNKWTKVLDNVKVDNTGARRPFNTSAYDAQGNRYTQYFDELEGKPVASQAQQMAHLGVVYKFMDFFLGLDATHFGKMIALDGGTYVATGGNFNTGGQYFYPFWSDHLPATVVYDFQAGGKFAFSGIHANVTFQILNIMDHEYLASNDRFGVIPGSLRTYRVSVSAGI